MRLLGTWSLWLLLCVASGVAAAAPDKPYRYAPPGAWVVDPIVLAPAGKPDAGEALYWWLADARTGFVDDQVKHYLHLAASVTNAEGVSQMAQQEITFAPDYQQVLLHRVGVWRDSQWQDRSASTQITEANREEQFEQGLTAGKRSLLLVVPDVRVGDLVEISYSVEGGNPILDGVDGGSLYLGSSAASRRLHAELVRDPDRSIAVTLRGPTTLKLPAWTRAGSLQRIVIDQRNTQALPGIDKVPAEHLLVPMLEYSEAEDWSAVVNWALALFVPQADDPAVVAALAPMRAIEAPEDRILAALHFVQQDVRYFAQLLGENSHRPHPLAQILERRLGDCKDKTLLLVSMLRGLGFDAYPALYSSDDESAVLSTLARGSVFDHVVVLLEYQGERYWLDPTVATQRGRLDELGFYTRGAALVVRAGQTAPTVTQPVSDLPATVQLSERLEVAADGHGELTMRFDYGREMAEYQRSRISTLGQSQLEQSYRAYYTQRFGPVDAAQAADWQLDQPGNKVSVEQRFKLASPTQIPGEASAIRIENSGMDDLFPAPAVLERDAPFAQMYPVELNYRFELHLAPGQELASAPKAMVIAAPGFRFEQSVQQESGALVLTQSARSLSRVVAAADLRAYARAIAQAHEQSGMRLHLLGARTDDDTRRDRLRKLLQGD